MQALSAFLALVATLAPHDAKPENLNKVVNTKSQFVEQRDVGLVRDALSVFYNECGFYPDELEKLLQPTEKQPSCLHGTKQSPLKSTPQNRSVIERLTYNPFGYDDFELSIKLFWTRDQ